MTRGSDDRKHSGSMVSSSYRQDVDSPAGDLMSRAASVADIQTGVPNKSREYIDTLRKLDCYYGVVRRQILRHQSISLGLFPFNSSDTEVADLRSSIYCATCVWGLYQAYRRIDDDRGRSMELSQSAVKCMRGILYCWMREVKLVEQFKQAPEPRYALHTKFHLVTGDPVNNEDNHLQVDLVPLYLLTLVQMTTSGLQIIYTMDEVNFIQNLVYYIERAYRTPDFGMWGRGTRNNNGTTEVHASSVGMAKAALESINGCNLFGDFGASQSVIYVDIDAHNRNRSIFEVMIPRESSTKNCDAALLPTVSYPCFATHDPEFYGSCRKEIVNKLKGRYGFKRFIRDGLGTVIEDKTRKYYQCGETKTFEGIESEWPIFFVFMILDGIFKDATDQVEEYQKLLGDVLIKDDFGDPLLPQYFYVSLEHIEIEREVPGRMPRRPSSVGSDDVFMWGQSVLLIAMMMTDRILHCSEIDPTRRFLPSYSRPRRAGRYSAFQGKHPSGGTASDLVVQVVLIAESMRLQAMMATYGIQTQTPHEIEPVQLWSPTELVRIYNYLGNNKRLNLSGRPNRPIGSLGTSKIYRIFGQTVLCYPLIFEVTDFYLSFDLSLLINDIKQELQFVGSYWRLSGRPTVCLLIREVHMRDAHFREMLDLLAMLKNGRCDDLKVRTGRVQNFISSSCIEHLDFVNLVEDLELDIQKFQQMEHASIGYQSLTDIPKAALYAENRQNYQEFHHKSTWDIEETFKICDTLNGRAQLLGILLKREGPDYNIGDSTVLKRLKLVNQQAGVHRHWDVVRYCTSLLEKLVDSLSPALTAIIVTGRQVSLGATDGNEVLITGATRPDKLNQLFFQKLAPNDPFAAVLQQEILLAAGKFINTHPDMFSGIFQFRIGWVIEAMRLYQHLITDSPQPLESQSPSRIRYLLQRVISVDEWAEDAGLTPLQRRKLEGCLCRVPLDFYTRVWNILDRSPKGVMICGHLLPQEPTLSEMTPGETGVMAKVEEMLALISHPEYRQLIVEMVLVISTILERNPELSFSEQVNLDVLIADSFQLFLRDKGKDINSKDMSTFYNTPVAALSSYLARAVVNHILRGDIIKQEDADACSIS